MTTIVFYDLWQMECCGIPFKNGDSVTWFVSANEDSKIKIDGLKYFYDAHNDDIEDIFILKGIIKDIDIYYEKYELVNRDGRNIYVPVDNTFKLVKTNSSLVKDENKGEFKASGYIVKLSNVNVTPYKKIT